MNDPNPSIAEVYRVAQEYQRQGNLAQARVCLTQVLQLQPDHADALHSLGNIDAREGRLNEAERLIRRAIVIDPLKAVFLNSLGNLMKARGNLDEAVKAYRLAVNLQPELAAGHNNLADVLLRQGEYEAAIDQCLKALASDPNYAGAFDTMGRALNNLGRLEDASAAFRRAVIIRPDYAVAYDHLGHVCRAQGKLDDAREAFEHALLLDPENASANYNLGTVLILQGDVDRSVENFEKARDARPRHIPTLLNLGIAYHTQGRLKLASDTYRQAIELEPADPMLHLNLGLVLVEQRRHEQAEECFLRALKLDSGLVKAYAELAAVYEEVGRLEDMEEVLRKGLELAADDPRLNLEASKADRHAGRVKEGIERLTAFDVQALDPRLAEQFHYQLGYLYDRAGQAEEAFANVSEANRLAGETVRGRRARPDRYLDMLEKLMDFFSTADVNAWVPAPPSDEVAPVFLFGFPRSGTALLSAALSGHTKISTVDDKPTITPVLDGIQDSPQGFPAGLGELGGDRILALREAYLTALAEFAPPGSGGLLVDHMPLRIAHAGVLWRFFPDARFLFCARHPCNAVLLNFMQHYKASDAFSNFLTIEGSISIYDKIMRLWSVYTERLPLAHHFVRYESLVQDPEPELRNALRFLQLSWDPAVLDQAQLALAQRETSGPAHHHIAEPAHADATGWWHAYSDYLAPHMDLLTPHIRRFGYEL